MRNRSIELINAASKVVMLARDPVVSIDDDLFPSTAKFGDPCSDL